jgi:CMP-2-keto-3-deoxyoctulosonic acid synthetase
MVETGLSSLHKLYTIKIQFICHGLLGKSGLNAFDLEKIEKLEQLRAIENGFSILVGKVKHTCDGIDTPQQYAEFVKRVKQNSQSI